MTSSNLSLSGATKKRFISLCASYSVEVGEARKAGDKKKHQAPKSKRENNLEPAEICHHPWQMLHHKAHGGSSSSQAITAKWTCLSSQVTLTTP